MSLKLTGFCRVANDPKLVEVGNTHKVFFTVVTQETRKSKDCGETILTPHFFNVEAWDSAATFIMSTVGRGDELYIEASPREEIREIDGETKKKVYFRINYFRSVN